MALQIVNGMALPTIAGNTYYVKKASDADYGQFVGSHLMTYNDGTQSVYNTVTAAVAAAQDKRGDMLLVCAPDVGTGGANTKWNEQVVITKAGLKIFALTNWWENQWRPGDASTKYAYTPTGGSASGGFAMFVAARGVEIGGFLFDGGGGYSGIYVGDLTNVTTAAAFGTNKNAAATYIHDCIFQGGNEGVYGINLDGCSADVLVERCVFNQWDNTAIYITPGGSRTCQHPIIRGCDFWAAPGGGYGIDMYSSATTVGVLVDRCIFRDGASANFTYGIRYQGAGVHSIMNSNFACTNKISASATDYVSGNFTVAAGNALNYVSVA